MINATYPHALQLIKPLFPWPSSTLALQHRAWSSPALPRSPCQRSLRSVLVLAQVTAAERDFSPHCLAQGSPCVWTQRAQELPSTRAPRKAARPSLGVGGTVFSVCQRLISPGCQDRSPADGESEPFRAPQTASPPCQHFPVPPLCQHPCPQPQRPPAAQLASPGVG